MNKIVLNKGTKYSIVINSSSIPGNYYNWAMMTTGDYATGEAIPHEPQTTKYIGTVFQGDFVWHVFELLIR